MAPSLTAGRCSPQRQGPLRFDQSRCPCGRREKELQAATAALGSNAFAIVADVSNLMHLDRDFAVVSELRGRLEVVFANAAVAEGAPISAVTEDHFDRHFDVKALPDQQGTSATRIAGSGHGAA